MVIHSKMRKALALTLLFTLAACGEGQTLAPSRDPGDTTPTWGDQKKPTIFGEGGLNLFGGKKSDTNQQGNGIGVNAYLWRATLDTLSFMPLASADPFGGVIITDWYSSPEAANERFKLTVVIQDRTLRADSLHVSTFRQVQNSNGQWEDSPVDAKTSTDLENTILTRAREMRADAVAAQNPN